MDAEHAALHQRGKRHHAKDHLDRLEEDQGVAQTYFAKEAVRHIHIASLMVAAQLGYRVRVEEPQREQHDQHL